MKRRDMRGTYSHDKNFTSQLKVKTVLVFILCVVLTVMSLFPFIVMIVNATRTNVEIGSQGISFIPGTHLLENFKTLQTNVNFKNVKIFLGFKNSFIITVCASFLTVFFSTLTAYGLTVYDFKLRNAAATFIYAVLMVPVQVSSVGNLRFMMQIGLYDTFWPLILPAAAAPAVVFFIRQYMQSSFPLEIVEAARIDGSNEFRTFLTIAIPMIKPAMAVQAIFAFIANWNNFYNPNILLRSPEKSTLPMMIANLSADTARTDYGAIYAATAISIVPMIIAYLILSKNIIAGVALGGVKE